MNGVVEQRDRNKRIVTPGIVMPELNWPIRHLNAGTAGVKQLLGTPGNDLSHYVTGFILGGGATADGFHILRRNCIQFTTTDTWTITDGGAKLDLANKASNGDFTIEVWVQVPAATTDLALLLKRGDETNNGYLLEMATGLMKFTIDDGTNSIDITGATAINDGERHLITVTLDRSSTTGLNIYVDGIRDATPVNPATLTAAVNPASTVVMTGTSSKTHYLGPIGFYGGSGGFLSAATVLANYNKGIGRKYHGAETNLVLGFNNDEGIGTAGHDVKNDAAYVVATSGTEWVPSKQNGGTAAVAVQGPPFEYDTVAADIEYLDAMGKFWTCLESATGVVMPITVNFPHAIKIGRNNPLRILETDGTADLIMFGFTDNWDRKL